MPYIAINSFFVDTVAALLWADTATEERVPGAGADCGETEWAGDLKGGWSQSNPGS